MLIDVKRYYVHVPAVFDIRRLHNHNIDFINIRMQRLA